MIIIKIDEILKSQKKSRYWLSKQIGMTQNNLSKLCNNKTSSIKFDNLEKICDVLNCKIEDIIEIKKDMNEDQ